MKKKYRLHPGYVISNFDGDEHYISAGRLAQLYGVNFNECVIANTPGNLGIRDDLENLYPRRDGNYKLHNKPFQADKQA